MTFLKIVHRGASAYEPENTLLAFKKALELGADAVELDVRATRDGELVVMHDHKLDRTTNGKGFVKNFSLKEIQRLDAGKGEPVPTLRQALEMLRGKAVVFVELKERGTESKAVALIEELRLEDTVFVVSFEAESIARVKKLNRGIRTGLISVLPAGVIDKTLDVKADAVLPQHTLVSKEFVDRAHASKLLVFAWAVDDPGEAQRLKDSGVDGVASNKPDILSSLR
jgi:glycerophosphoryl diester phosphodiesterase